MKTPSQTAVERFAGPYSCSQAVFSAFAPQHGLSDELALKIASALGGGLARQGHVCGAVSGALLVIGLARGRADPHQKEAVYELGRAFIDRFQALHASVQCRDLLGYDLSDPEDARAAREAGASGRLCPAFVRDAAVLLEELLP